MGTGSSSVLAHRSREEAVVAQRVVGLREPDHSTSYTRLEGQLSSGKTLGTPAGRTGIRRHRRRQGGHSLNGRQSNEKSSQGHAPVHQPARLGCQRAGRRNIYPSDPIGGKGGRGRRWRDEGWRGGGTTEDWGKNLPKQGGLNKRNGSTIDG